MIATWLSAFRLALGAIMRNKLRAALTVLGIFIGISAVVIVTAAGTSATNLVGGEIDALAANALFVFPRPVAASGARSRTVGRITEMDGRAIMAGAAAVSGVAPWLSTNAQIVYGDKNWSTTIGGTTLAYFPIRRFEVGTGSLWSETDELLKTKVCLVGRTVATSLFGNEDPVGHTIRIGRSPYTIIGELAPRGTSLVGDDQDDRVLMPIGSFRARVMHTAPGRADQLIISATGDNTVNRAKAEIESILRERHHCEPGRDDFQVASQAEFRAATGSILGALSSLLLGIAAISLLVGGIGVMNIMLVTVAERTREIGIRMSIGARERDILVQFLVEAIVLTLVGGVLGILAGGLGAVGIGQALDMHMTPSPKAIGVAVATSAFIGTVFGLLPALRAAKLDPIAALRVE